MNDTCVVYHYFESDDSCGENLLHFLNFGYRPDIDYHFVVAGPSTVAIPTLANISVTQIENKNLDFGGYSAAVNHLVPLARYRNFIFLNSSVRGPFVPTYVDNWTRPLLSLLSDDVGLVGSTINILNPDYDYSKTYQDAYGGRPPYAHVQTMCFAVRDVVLQRLFDDGFFDLGDWESKDDVITNAELRLSRLVIEYGKNLRCLIAQYNEIDYRQPHADINSTSVNGDPVYPGALFGRTIHPFEAIFIKTNRNLWTEDFLASLAGNCAAPPARPVVAVVERSAGVSNPVGLPAQTLNYLLGTPRTLRG